MILDRSLQNSIWTGTENVLPAKAHGAHDRRGTGKGASAWGIPVGKHHGARRLAVVRRGGAAGVVDGLAVPDMIFARFLVAGAIMLPLLVRWGPADPGRYGLKGAPVS